MIIYSRIAILLIFWLIAVGAIIRKNWREKDINSALTVIYVVNLCLQYAVAALLYLLPWHQYINGKWMLNGFTEATFAVCAFAIGNLILATPITRSILLHPEKHNVTDRVVPRSPYKRAKTYFWIGLIFYTILPPFLIGYPTITSIMIAAQQLMTTGLCLICWQAWSEKNKNKFNRWLLISFSLPFLSIIYHGFLGAGLMMVLIILFFVARFFIPRWKTLIIAVLLIYLGLSLYLSYMRDREDIRTVIRAHAGLSERIGTLKNTVTNPIWFNPFSLEQLEIIDERMNQNILLGAVVEHLNSGAVDYAYGKTLWDSVIALIPRAIWPEKYIVAGGSVLVSKYTGIAFGEETSVGTGQAMELYINFGRMGVIIGFLVLGIIVAIIDMRAGQYLLAGNLDKFILWFLPGLASLMSGSFVEATASAGAAVFVVLSITSLNIWFALPIAYLMFEVIRRVILGLLRL